MKQWPVVIAANRLPVHRAQRHGRAQWVPSPGGLVSALVPIVRQAEGAWVGWTGTTGEPPEPFEHDGIMQVPLRLSASDARLFYQGFCNSTLWPLYHDGVGIAEYQRAFWRAYLAVNARVARVMGDITDRGGLVWIHDYHLQLVPALLRKRRPDLRIGFFLHTPFPPADLYARLPWRTELLKGVLGADVIGFQTPASARNFRYAAERYTEGAVSGDSVAIAGRRAEVGAFPISIDFAKYDGAARDDEVRQRAAQLRKRLSPRRKVILGVDRLDYTKGISRRLQAFQEVLASGKHALHDCVLVQVAVPSRERVAEYVGLRREVEELVGQINGHFGEVGTAPVHYLRRNMHFEELVAMYCAADVMLVTPLVDGMNLVAKEYVATRVNDTGVLVLSEFAGAAQELTQALVINPYDGHGLAGAIDRALDMADDEAGVRMSAMRATVRRHTVFDWAASFMGALEAVPSRNH